MKHSIVSTAFVFAAACGGGGEPVHKGTIDSQGASRSIDGVSDVFAALDTKNGESAADAVLALTAAGQIVVSPGQARELPAQAYMMSTWPRSKTRAPFTGSADCNDNGCTFNNYGDDSDYGSYRINGSISRSGDTVTFDLTYDITTSQLEFHWSMDGHVRVNASLIDGEINSNGTARVATDDGTYNIGWDVDIDYDNIGLDAGGCPISGALSAEVGYTVSGAQSGSYRAAGSVHFGPACGQFSSN